MGLDIQGLGGLEVEEGPAYAVFCGHVWSQAIIAQHGKYLLSVRLSNESKERVGEDSSCRLGAAEFMEYTRRSEARGRPRSLGSNPYLMARLTRHTQYGSPGW